MQTIHQRDAPAHCPCPEVWPLQVTSLLSAATHAHRLSWWSLKALKLSSMMLDDLPACMAESLKGLTCLDLYDNLFKRIPPCAASITTLELFDLASNAPLHLDLADVEVLSALPNLKLMKLHKAGVPGDFWKKHDLAVWSNNDMKVVCAVKQRLPGLVLSFEV